MAYLDDILSKINDTEEEDKDKDEQETKPDETDKPKDGLLTYSDEFYKEFEK